eukprot:4057997-Ditylum_brightwellii.AAC.1
MRDVAVQENVIKASKRQSIVTIMVCVTMAQTSATLYRAKEHIQPMHHIMEQQRLQQVRFVKDAERQAKRRGLTGKEVKDLN